MILHEKGKDKEKKVGSRVKKGCRKEVRGKEKE